MSWNPTAIDQAVEQKMGGAPDPAPAAAPAPTQPDPAAAAPEAPPPPSPETPPAVPETPLAGAEPAQPAAAEPPAAASEAVDDTTQWKPAYEAVESIGGLEELDLMSTLAKPLMGPNLDVRGFINAVAQNRGEAAYNDLTWGIFDLHPGAFANELLNNPAFDPNTIRDAAIREQVIRLRAGGGPARPQPVAPVQPAPSLPVESAGVAVLPQLNLDDYDELPKPIADFIAAAQGLAPALATLQSEVNALKGYRESETQRVERERREAVEAETVTRVTSLTSQLHSVIDSLLAPVSFSTAIDAAAAAEENADIRKDIKARVINDLDFDSSFDEVYARARTMYIQGDRIGARGDVRALKEIVDRVVKERITARGGKLKATIAPSAPVTTNRVQVSGAGSGSAPMLPTPPAAKAGGKAWEDMDAQIDRKFAAQQSRAPVG